MAHLPNQKSQVTVLNYQENISTETTIYFSDDDQNYYVYYKVPKSWEWIPKYVKPVDLPWLLEIWATTLDDVTVIEIIPNRYDLSNPNQYTNCLKEIACYLAADQGNDMGYQNYLYYLIAKDTGHTADNVDDYRYVNEILEAVLKNK